MGQQVAGCG